VGRKRKRGKRGPKKGRNPVQMAKLFAPPTKWRKLVIRRKKEGELAINNLANKPQKRNGGGGESGKKMPTFCEGPGA